MLQKKRQLINKLSLRPSNILHKIRTYDDEISTMIEKSIIGANISDFLQTLETYK